MPASHPSDDQLRAASKIILVDRSRPGWVMPLHVRGVGGGGTLEIDVDSTDAAVGLAWRKRINALNLPG